jgi:hypothetical protein
MMCLFEEVSCRVLLTTQKIVCFDSTASEESRDVVGSLHFAMLDVIKKRKAIFFYFFYPLPPCFALESALPWHGRRFERKQKRFPSPLNIFESKISDYRSSVDRFQRQSTAHALRLSVLANQKN